MDSVGSGNLQSGIVLAVVLAAFFFAERLGGSDQLARRVFQVGLGVVLALAVIAGTTAFVRTPSAPAALLQNSFGSSSSDGSSSDSSSQSLQGAKDYNRDAANHDSTRDMIRAGAGVLLLVAGLAALKRLPVTALSGALGGLLLILFGGVRAPSPGTDQSGLNAFFSLYSSVIGGVFGGPSRSVEIAHFVVLAGAAVVLIAFGVMRWDGEAPQQPTAAPETSV